MLILCDIDGVIVDPTVQVLKYLAILVPDWKGYFAQTALMPEIPSVIGLVTALSLAGNRVIFHTCRPESNGEATYEYLKAHLLNIKGPYELVMRHEEDRRPGYVIKLENCKLYKPQLVLDDEPSTVKVLTAAGFVVLQVHGHRIDGQKEDRIPA